MKTKNLKLFATLTVLFAFGSLVRDITLPGIPLLVSEFGISQSDALLSFNAFMVSFAVGQLFCGFLADTHGNRKILLGGIYLCLFASVICFFAPNNEVLIFGRLLQGLSASVGPIIARSTIGELYTDQHAASYMAKVSGTMSVIPGIIPIIGSWLLIWFSWRSHYLFIVFACGVILPLAYLLIPAPSTTKASTLSFNVFLQRLLYYFKNPQFRVYVIIACCIFAAMFAFLYTLPFLLIDLIKIKPENFGYLFLFISAGYMCGAYTNAYIVLKIGITKALSIGSILLIVSGTLGSALALAGYMTVSSIVLCGFITFMAAGFMIANTQAACFQLFPDHMGGTASALGFIKLMSGALSGFIVGQLYSGSFLPTTTVCFLAGIISTLLLLSLTREVTSNIEK